VHDFFFFGGQKLVKKLLAEAFARQKKYLHSKTAEKKNRARRAVLMCRYFFGIAQTPLPLVI